MTTPSEDTTLAGEGWRKGDKTSQGLDAYELLARAHKTAQAEIESLTAQLIHRTRQRDNQIATIRELTAVNAGLKVRNEDAGRLIEAQNITVEQQTNLIARLREDVRDLRERNIRIGQEYEQAARGDQRNLTSVHDLEDELQGLKVEREKLLQIYRELSRDKGTLEHLLGVEKGAVSELRAQVDRATFDRKSVIARADELLAERDNLEERLQRVERFRTEDQAAIKQQAETIKAIRSERDELKAKVAELSAQVENAQRRITEAESVASRLAKQLDEQRRISADAVSDRGRVPSLISALDQIQNAVLGTLEVTSNAGSGVRQVAEARRRQRLKYSVEHDYHDSHGTSALVNAAVALLTLDPSYWPSEFDRDTYAELASEDTDRLATAGAFCCAVLDVLEYAKRREESRGGES